MKKNTFVEGTIIAYIAILMTKLLGVIYVIPFYQIIGSEGGVLYAYAYNIFSLFLTLSTLGIPIALSIIIAEYNAIGKFKEMEFANKVATRLIAIIAVIMFLIMFTCAPLIAGIFHIGHGGSSIESVTLVIRAISFSILIVPFLSLTRGYLQGNKFIAVSGISQFIEQFIRVFVLLVGSYVAIHILHYDIPVGVAFALVGTTAGGLGALLFLKRKIRRHRANYKEETDDRELEVTKTEVRKKIAIYAFPVIVVAATQSLYNIADLAMIVRGLNMIGYEAAEAELIASIIVTWAPKICVIIEALAIGLSASIIPFIVNSSVNNDSKEVNRKFNQAISIILFVTIPLAAFIIVFAPYIYYAFYGSSVHGGTILSVLAIVSILFSIQIVVNMALQGLKKHKIIYLNCFSGLAVNVILNIPLILLLNRLNFFPFVGTLLATITGISVSIAIVFIGLKKGFSFKYRNIIRCLKRTILITILVLPIMILFRHFLFGEQSYMMTLVFLGISGLTSMGLYVLITYKNKYMFEIFGEETINKVLIKLRLRRP